MNSKQAKTVPLALLLEKIGYQPIRERHGEALYFSPLRVERTPSFHVNQLKNAWYDFGEGRGGNTLDFVLAFLASQKEASTVYDALRWMTNIAGHMPAALSHHHAPANKVEPCITIKKKTPIQHRALLSYLVKRGIAIDLTSPYLFELTVLNSDSGKHFFALGMRNEEDGHELRNPFFRAAPDQRI